MRQNYQIKSIAERIHRFYPDCSVTVAQTNSADSRNYTVSFGKIERQLGCSATLSLDDGISELKNVYDEIQLDSKTFEHPLYTRLKQVERLMASGKIDKDLHWAR